MDNELTFEHLVTAELSDLGMRRSRNEDAIVRIPEEGVFCVADGIGGSEVGHEASSLTVNMLHDEFTCVENHPAASEFEYRKGLVRKAMNKASQAIQNYCAERSYKSSGTTAVTILFDKRDPRRAAVLHAGDSRAYRIRDNQIEQLTRDHTMAMEHSFPSDSAWAHGMRTIITRAVGVRPFVELDEKEVDVLPGDVFLLCSDGLTRMLCDDVISHLISIQGEDDLEVTVSKLVAEANEAGGMDNITVLLVRVGNIVDDMRKQETQGSLWGLMMRSFGRWPLQRRE